MKMNRWNRCICLIKEKKLNFVNCFEWNVNRGEYKIWKNLPRIDEKCQKENKVQIIIIQLYHHRLKLSTCQ